MDATDGTAAEEGCVDSGTPDGWPLTFTALAEPFPGPGWQGAFSSAWPSYRRWYLRDGMSARTDLDTCAGMLTRHMPELVPTWERLVELAGGDPLARLPVHMAYNVTVADRSGDYFTAYLGPDRVPHFTADPVATDTEPPAGPGPVSAPHSQHRRDVLAALVYDEAVDLDGLVAAFLEPPLYAGHHEHGFGTLYTAVYRPADLTLEYRWPGSSCRHSIGPVGSSQHQVVLGGRPCSQP